MSAATNIEILMPRLSDSLQEGVIVRWLVGDGDEVAVGQDIVEVETDKATMAYESEHAGPIHLRVAAGDTVAVGALIAVIGDDEHNEADAKLSSDSRKDGTAELLSPLSGEAAPARTAGKVASTRVSNGRRRLNVSPVARRIAAARGVDLASIAGTGPNGRITKTDLENSATEFYESTPGRGWTGTEQPSSDHEPTRPARSAAVGPSAAPEGKGEITTRELSRLQQVVARRMALAKATTPEFVLTTHVDMESVVALRMKLREIIGDGDVLPSYNDFVVKACALALRAEPLANGSYRDGQFELHSRVNVGIAVAAPNALLVPTIFDADRLSLGSIARATRDLARKVRDGTISPPELSGGTFSISNLGMFGVDEFTAIINPPQAAILAVGALAERAVVRNRELTARHMMTISLTCDHRILYGSSAAEFLAEIRGRLDAPESLVL